MSIVTNRCFPLYFFHQEEGRQSAVMETADQMEDQLVELTISDIPDVQDADGAAPPEAPTKTMNIVFVASEVAPWSKTGGLGDVMGSLPAALAARGHRVMVVAPRYGQYEDAEDTGVRLPPNTSA